MILMITGMDIRLTHRDSPREATPTSCSTQRGPTQRTQYTLIKGYTLKTNRGLIIMI